MQIPQILKHYKSETLLDPSIWGRENLSSPSCNRSHTPRSFCMPLSNCYCLPHLPLLVFYDPFHALTSWQKKYLLCTLFPLKCILWFLGGMHWGVSFFLIVSLLTLMLILISFFKSKFHRDSAPFFISLFSVPGILQVSNKYLLI